MIKTLRKTVVQGSIVLCLALIVSVVQLPLTATAESATVPTSPIFFDDFESGTLDAWHIVSDSNCSLVPNGGHNGSYGLSVVAGSSERYIWQQDVASVEEGYFTFWFNPTGVNIPDEGTTWVPGKSFRFASVKGEQWYLMAGLRIRRPQGQGYKAFLEWYGPDGVHYDHSAGEFDLVDGWQKITLGFRTDEWVAAWLNGVEIRKVQGVQHRDAFGEIIEIGQTSTASAIVPSGELRYDDIAFEIPRIQDLWVDASNGDDNNDGLNASTAFRSIQKAADMAGPGTMVHIQAGIYRETVAPAADGGAGEPVVYVAENGPGTAVIRGSESVPPSSWVQLTNNSIGLPSGVDPAEIYYTDLSAWNLSGPPQFVVDLDGGGAVNSRLPLAREPDWQVATEWKHHEFWWAADGGSGVAGCDPSSNPDPNCDSPWRSSTQLTDSTHDTGIPGIEQGDLTTLGDLTGATLVAMDTKQGHYVYRRTITSHNVSAGRVTVDEPCGDDLGWGSKYYVEGSPKLLDSPGEWWYDAGTGRLYFWPPSPGDPTAMHVEVSKRNIGFDFSGRSYVTLDGITLEFLELSAVFQYNSDSTRSYGNTVRNATMRFADRGTYLVQGTGDVAANLTDGFTLEYSEIANIDSEAIYLNHWWENGSHPDSFRFPGIVNTVIRSNELHHLGFRSGSDNPLGALFNHAAKLRFEGNHLHHVAQNGMMFSRSVIQSPREYGFDPGEIKTGEILVKDNIFEKACQLTTDCGALKFWGEPPNNHVFRDVLVTGNVFRNTFGWTYVAGQRGRWSAGSSSAVQGMGGFGLYIDMASGIHAYRNTAYNNAYTGFMCTGNWRDGAMLYYNNIAANSLFGVYLAEWNSSSHVGSFDTQFINNNVLNNEGYGLVHSSSDGTYGQISINHNLYFNNGWRSYDSGGLWEAGPMAIWWHDSPDQYLQTLDEIQANTPWEDQGEAGDPRFQDYDANDHDLSDGSWPDFRLTAQSSKAIDKGTSSLPGSLTNLLTHFGLDQSYVGAAFDIGPHEYESGGFVKTADTLLVADDNPGSSNPYASYYTAALSSLGHAHDLWDTGVRGAPGSSILNQYSDGTVIWSVPGSSGYLEDGGVRSSLQAYLDGGGKLFISGQDVAYMTRGSVFLNEYLHAAYVQNSTGIQNLLGVAGDPIGEGLALGIDGGSGAGNQSSTDEVDSLGPAWPAFTYDDGAPAGTAGLRVNTGAYKIVYLPFGFEGIDNAADRATVMQRTLDWLAGSSTVMQIGLSPGWNLASWPLEPLIPEVDGALRTIESLTCRVVGEGGVYDCQLDPVYHTLKDLHAGQAYYLHVGGSNSADLWVEGAPVAVSTPLPLHEYWNWAGYLPTSPLPIATALQSIEGKYLMVHSIDKTYNPAEPLYSTLTQMEPGQGYLVRATEAVDLIYPAGTTSSQTVPDQASSDACSTVSPTPTFAVIYGEIAIGASPAPAGTVVEVLDPSGSVAGCSIVRHAGHYGYLHLYAQEAEDLPGPGFREGDPLTIRVNGATVSGSPNLEWANDPTPRQIDVGIMRNPAYLPLIQGTR